MAKISIDGDLWFTEESSRKFACSATTAWWQTAKGSWVKEDSSASPSTYMIGTERMAQDDIAAQNPSIAGSVSWQIKNLEDPFPPDQEV